VDLGSEFGFGSGFPADDGSDVGLIDTHYAVRYLMARCPKHLQLLVTNGLDDPVALLHLMGEWKHDKTVKLLFNGLEVSSQVLKLGFDALSDDLSGGISVLGHFQKVLSGHFSVGSWLFSK